MPIVVHPAPRVVTLAIDPGKVSGWAVDSQWRMTCGEARTPKDRADAIHQAISDAAREACPVLVIAEMWTAGGWASVKSMFGIGAQWGRWEEQLEIAGLTQIDRVYPQTWRPAVLGKGRRKTEQWKAEAIAFAKNRIGVDVGPDTAEALCILTWYQGSDLFQESLAKAERKNMREKKRASFAKEEELH